VTIFVWSKNVTSDRILLNNIDSFLQIKTNFLVTKFLQRFKLVKDFVGSKNTSDNILPKKKVQESEKSYFTDEKVPFRSGRPLLKKCDSIKAALLYIEFLVTSFVLLHK